MCPELETPPLRADAARNRQRILDVAREVVSSGQLSPSLNGIAKRAGVGVGTVYRHFADHQALIEALAEQQLDSLIAALDDALREPDPNARLAAMFRRTLALIAANPCLSRILATDASYRERTAEKLAMIEASIGAILAKAQAAGGLRSDVTSDDVQRLICGVEHAVRLSPDREAATQRYTAILLAGLRPEAPTGPPAF